jgi:two-component system response regulator
MRVILLVEDNESDELLTTRALKKANIENAMVVARDGEEALDYLFGRGPYAGRAVSDLPAVVLLDLNLPKIGGLDVLRSIRADERTRRVPLRRRTKTSSGAPISAPTLTFANRSTSDSSPRP